MDEAFLSFLESEYASYVDSFRDGNGELPRMMQLKLDHTMHVVENAKAIMEGERFDPLASLVGRAASLLHDTGRYEQLLRYNTFRDADSVDHAALSHDIVAKKGWLDGIPERDAVLAAVRVHNMREIPEEVNDPLALAVSKVVRDADKLDIFRVLENEIATSDWKTDCKAFWNLPVFADPGDTVVECIRKGTSVHYGEIKTLADFILVQVGWIRSELYFETTRKIAAERKHIEFRRDFLHEISSSPAIDELCSV